MKTCNVVIILLAIIAVLSCTQEAGAVRVSRQVETGMPKTCVNDKQCGRSGYCLNNMCWPELCNNGNECPIDARAAIPGNKAISHIIMCV
mmetsp:Transcript_2230/g.6653  ORF Transcript_2230/g.6653 Transcript_2230/m.6653 type:complete len:90 (-) Transcript_2230:82-351(-)